MLKKQLDASLLELEIEKLKLVLIPCRESIPEEAYQIYDSAYHLWERVWSQTLKELDGVDKLFSNEFTRHDFATVICYDNVAIGLLCYSSVNLKLQARKNDAWFESWPQSLLATQAKLDGDGLIAAWFCVSPEYQKSKSTYPFDTAKLILEAFGKIVLTDGFNVGYGTSRNNRGVNKMLYDIGGEKCGESSAHGCDVDLVLVRPEKIREFEVSYSNIFKKIWQDRIDYRKLQMEKKNEKDLSRAA